MAFGVLLFPGFKASFRSMAYIRGSLRPVAKMKSSANTVCAVVYSSKLLTIIKFLSFIEAILRLVMLHAIVRFLISLARGWVSCDSNEVFRLYKGRPVANVPSTCYIFCGHRQ